jgi:predicted Holliday junction resolvase-like endonuclease
MSNDNVQTPAVVLIMSAVKTVGKREFLKTVKSIFGTKQTPRAVKETVAEEQCEARVKGERTGIKAGRYVLFDAVRCDRQQVDEKLCAIHRNQVKKFGELLFGRVTEPLTDKLKKVFGDI